MKHLILLLAALPALAQTQLFNVSTGTTCTGTLSGQTAALTCTHKGKLVMSATISLDSILGNTSGVVIGFRAQDAVTMLFKRQAVGDPLTIEIVVNDQPMEVKSIPVG